MITGDILNHADVEIQQRGQWVQFMQFQSNAAAVPGTAPYAPSDQEAGGIRQGLVFGYISGGYATELIVDRGLVLC